MSLPELRDIATRFDLGDITADPTLVARGANGLIWKVTTDSGVFAVKQLQEWADAPAVPFDVEVQLAAARAGVRLPQPVMTPDGIAVVERGRVYEWVDLLPEMRLPVPIAIAASIGDVLGRIHRLDVAAPTDRLDDWDTVPPRPEQWESLVARATKSGQPWAQVLAPDTGFLDEVGRRFAGGTPGPLITCHRDFGPKNILRSAADGSLVVLDWENAGSLPANAEVASALLWWTTTAGDADLDSAASMLAAYREATGRREPIRENSFNVAVVTYLNFFKVIADQAIHDEANREFAEGLLPWLMPDALRRKLLAIETLLSADL